MFGLGHLDVMPLFYGVIMFIGVWSMWRKLLTAQFVALGIEIGVFVLVFTLHGGTLAGGFAAMIAALLAGFFLPRSLRRKS